MSAFLPALALVAILLIHSVICIRRGYGLVLIVGLVLYPIPIGGTLCRAVNTALFGVERCAASSVRAALIEQGEKP